MLNNEGKVFAISDQMAQALQLFSCGKECRIITDWPPSCRTSAEAVVSVHSQWSKLCAAHHLQRSDAKIFMILFCGCLYDELLRQCHKIIEPNIQASELCSEDSEDVHYRIGGSTMSNMLHSKYTKIKSCPLNQEDRVSQEITVLQQISIHKKEDKDHMPGYLKYRDEGYMYFPCVEQLPFLKAVDVAIKEEINNTTFS